MRARLVIVFVFLATYYYLSGLVAFLAVLINLVLIVGAMAMINATFTLPGVAGTRAVGGHRRRRQRFDLRTPAREQARGLGLKMALRNSYDRAFSAILDGQVTTAISSAFLYVFGSEEVRGFGLTLMIGIVTSLFTALYVTKTMFGLMVDKLHVNDLSSLPRTFPRWNRLLTPNIDWMKLSWIFIAFSAIFIGGGLLCFGMKLSQGQALDIEFSGGTAVRVELKPEAAMDRGRDAAARGRRSRQAARRHGRAACGGDRQRQHAVRDLHADHRRQGRAVGRDRGDRVEAQDRPAEQLRERQ